MNLKKQKKKKSKKIHTLLVNNFELFDDKLKFLVFNTLIKLKKKNIILNSAILYMILKN